MLHSLQRSEFLRPRERLHELLALQQIAAGVRDGSTIGTERLADMRTMAGQLQELLQRGLVRATLSAEGTNYVLSEAGQSRLRVLIVDLARELETLTESTRTLLRADLVPLTRAGVERVVLYPFGKTAEMALDPTTHDRIKRVLTEQRDRAHIQSHGLAPLRRLLLVGPPGTGKTMTAAALARELSIPLFSIQLHSLITKYLGETAAKKHLQQLGLKFLAANVRTRRGELDLVFRDDDCLVLVEVKTRSSGQWTRPARAVDSSKRTKLSRAAFDYLRMLPDPNVKFRFDIVEVLLKDGEVNEIRHLPNAFNLTRGPVRRR